MADKLKQSGYFAWIPIEYYRERPKGILINQSTYPTSFTTLYKQKLDFAVMRCSYESATSVYTADTYFTDTSIRAFESRGITTLAYHQIVNNPTYWTQVKAEAHATSFYNALSTAYATLGKEFIPVVVFGDNTTAFNISALYSYLSYFKNKFATLSNKEIIFSSDRASFSYCTYNTSVRIADLFPKLMLDKAESYDYSGLAYPQTVHTKFDRWVDWSFWVYTRSNSLGSTYGLNTAAAILIIADTNYINRLNPQEYTNNKIPIKVDLFVLDEYLDTQGYITGHNLKWQRKINGIDILQGEVWESCDYLAEGNYVLFKDPFRQVWEMFEIMEIDYNINSKNIYCEHISHTLLDDIVHSTTITTTSNISTHISNILSSTYSTNGIWEAGTRFGGAGLSSQVANQRLKNLMEAIIHIRDVFGFELVFRPQIVSRRTDALTPNYQGFFIDMYFFIGRHDNDFRLEVGNNVTNLQRHVDYKDIVTAIFPYSPSVTSATWLAYVATAGGGNYSKVVNNRLIRYVPSESRYGRNIYSTIKNKIATYEGTETTAAALFDNAVLSLQDMNKNSKVSYECDIFDVEVCLGDNITIYNSDIKAKVWGEDLPTQDSDYGDTEYFYNKNLRIQGRITEIEYELNDMRNVKINIGNVREDFTDSYTS